MGYDCTIILNDPTSDPCPEVDWENEASRENYEAWCDRNYFRRNVWGMEHLRDAMVQLGMAFTDFDVMPDFPDAEAWGVRFNEWKNADGKWESGYVGTRSKEYEAEIERVLRFHGPEIPGIPMHKFCSNDGWIVTREECQAALGLYEFALRDGKGHPDAFGDDFIPFLRQAARHKGFEVA